MKKSLIFWTVLGVFSLRIFGQTSNNQSSTLSEKELQAARDIMTKFNTQLEVELKKRAEYPQMLKDIQALKEIKDPNLSRSAVKIYQNTYKKTLDESIAKAGLDIKKLHMSLATVLKMGTWTYNDYSIIYNRIVQGTLTPIITSSRTETVALTGFTEAVEKQQLGGIASHAFSSNSLVSFVRVEQGGTNEIKIALDKDFNLPTDAKKITINVKATVAIDAYSYTLGAFSSSYTQIVFHPFGPKGLNHITAGTIALPSAPYTRVIHVFGVIGWVSQDGFQAPINESYVVKRPLNSGETANPLMNPTSIATGFAIRSQTIVAGIGSQAGAQASVSDIRIEALLEY